MEEVTDNGVISELHIELIQRDEAVIRTILTECVLKLSFFRARHVEIDGTLDLRPLRYRANEPYREPYRPITQKDVNLWERKLAWDLSILQKILLICRDELFESGRYSTLEKLEGNLKELVSEEKYYKQLLKQKPTETVDRSYKNKQNHEEKIEEMKMKRKKLEDLHEETAFRCKIIRKYFENYQRSRIEENKYRVRLAEEKLQQKMVETCADTTKEERAHGLIMEFLTKGLIRLDEKLFYWKNEKKKDVDWRNTEIKKLDEEQQQQTTKLQGLYVDYARREKEIEDYKVEQEERRKLEEIEEHRRKCAVKIQAWWRGCMVRFNLGPFCPDHLKKKKKKCKKK